jgi:polysaccharide export outer membrane protein
MKNLLNCRITGGVLFFLILLSSCISPKSITYVNNLPQGPLINLDSLAIPQPIVVINDLIEIHIGGENEKTVQYINQYLMSGAGAGTSGGASTAGGGNQYTVDVDGNITLPKIGKIKMAGLTRDQARDTLTNLYKQYLIDPIVSVKFSNFRFSVIGEVKQPGTFTVTSEKVNIFEALAQAGDITNFGRFERVHILRDVNGKRQIITVDLTNKNILNSENFYINRYDLIYVESRNLKYVTDNVTRAVTFISAAFSIIAIILVLKK